MVWKKKNILSLIHTFLSIIFCCCKFHLIGPKNDNNTLDPSDWSTVGILAWLINCEIYDIYFMFKFFVNCDLF